LPLNFMWKLFGILSTGKTTEINSNIQWRPKV
jgi:hypothetical protein